MSRLIVVSNRLPINISKSSKGLSLKPSPGGLATGLSSVLPSYENLWIGWPGVASDKLKPADKKQIRQKLAENNSLGVFLSKSDVENYYHGFCNKTIWPLFHYFPLYTIYEPRFWDRYKRVNKHFCDVVTEAMRPGDKIWVHDYQLMLLPQMLRDRMPDAEIGFFLHIPFPSFELFRLLPWRMEILEGLLGADVVGFHTYDFVRHFISSASRLGGHEHTFGRLTVDNRVIKVDAFPMGIDYKRYSGAVQQPAVQSEIRKIRKKLGDRRIIISIDRLDYTKGIIQRLEAFDLFLSRNPEYKEKVSLILLAVPSRTGVDKYKALRNRLEALVGRVNGEHGTMGWMPVWYLYRAVPFERLIALYGLGDVALVTPLRDGMNLIAKEFVATKTDGRGVLILSEMAGAVSELGEAVIVNANNKLAVLEAIKEALNMPLADQIERNRLMQARLSRYDVARWTREFVDALCEIKQVQQELSVRKLTDRARGNLLSDYRKAKSRLLLLDYDGTLVGFVGRPEKAGPDQHLLRNLQALCDDRKNEMVIISGRDKQTLENWLGELNVNLVAEHGAWIRRKGGKWQVIEPLNTEWKEAIRPILELYVDRTPGSFVEEKNYSLVWHCRKADPTLAYVRTQELKDAVTNLSANLDVGVLEGHKIIEVKNIGVNKGRAVGEWLHRKKRDFVFAVGDDRTDEDTFAALPETAYSIRVGYGLSKARFSVDSVSKIRSLLDEFVRS